MDRSLGGNGHEGSTASARGPRTGLRRLPILHPPLASGRVQVLDRPEAEAKALAEAAAKTDGVIWKLWMDETVPSGRARIGQAVGHKPRTR